MTKSAIPHQRRLFIIDRAFQLDLIVRYCAIVVMTGLLSAFGLLLWHQLSPNVTFDQHGLIIKTPADWLEPKVVQIYLISVVFGCLTTAALTLYVTHKISGPLYRLVQNVHRMSMADLSEPVQIRDDDQFQNIGASLEEMRSNWHERSRRLKRHWSRLKPLLEQHGLDRDRNIKDITDLLDEIQL
jgi:methyl-accepting chemotaxis protein